MESEQEMRRLRLVALVDRHFARDNDLVASVIEQKTGDKVSVRTVQAWLISPGRTSSRQCPERAVKALEEYVADPANRARLDACVTRREASVRTVKGALEWSDEVRRDKAVEFATASLEDDARRLRSWQEAGGVHLGKKLFEMESRFNADTQSTMDAVIAIHEALRTSSTFDEWRSKVQEQDRANSLARFFVREAKRAIEGRSEEFAAPDAVTEQPATRDIGHS
jgi:hypothetical protein